jgi:hypothetical protein
VDVAVEILKYALYKEVKGKKSKAKKARLDGDVEEEEQEKGSDDESEDEKDFDKMDSEKNSTLRYYIFLLILVNRAENVMVKTL